MTPGRPDRDSAELYVDLYERAPCGYVSTALDGTILRVNQTLLAWTGHDADDLLDSTRFADLLAPGSRLFYETHHLAQLERTGELHSAALDLRRRDGSTFPALVSSTIVEPEPGRRVIRTTVLDAAERRRYEQTLVEAQARAEQSEQRLQVLQRITEACVGSLDPEAVGSAVASAAAEATGGGCALWLADHDAGHLRLVSCAGFDALPPDAVPLDDPSPPARAWRDDEVVTVDPGPLEAGGVPVPHHEVDLPLHGEATVLGVVGFRLRADRPLTGDDLTLLRTAASQIGQALDRARLHTALRHTAHHDELTGLPNRALLRDRFDAAAARAGRTGGDLAVLVIDLDGFKAVNDSLGHAAGDRVLVDVAHRLRAVLRPNDTAARLGGDEFAVVCEDTDEAGARALATRIARLVRTELPLGEDRLCVGVSVGSAVRLGHETATLDELLALADRSMYDAKLAGRATTT